MITAAKSELVVNHVTVALQNENALPVKYHLLPFFHAILGDFAKLSF